MSNSFSNFKRKYFNSMKTEKIDEVLRVFAFQINVRSTLHNLICYRHTRWGPGQEVIYYTRNMY